jgi:hypothetical protein
MAQGIGLAGGYGAGGAGDALTQLLARKFAEAELAERQRSSMAGERQAADDRAFTRQRATKQDERTARLDAEAAKAREEESVSVDTVDEEGNPVTRFMRPAEVRGQSFKKLLKKEPTRTTRIDTVDPKSGRPVTRVMPEEEALGQTFPKYVEPREPRAPRDERLVQIAGPGGAAIWVRESDAVGKSAAQAARSVTGSERQTLSFYNRAKDASDTVTTGKSGESLEERVSGVGLLGQAQLEYAPNVFQNQEQQSYRQAQRAFTEARLRKESGAAIPDAEYASDAKTYFAQPGDTKETIAQKRKARQAVLDGLKFSSGKAYDEFYGESGAGGGERKVGDRKTFPNGNVGVWDGSRWVKQ